MQELPQQHFLVQQRRPRSAFDPWQLPCAGHNVLGNWNFVDWGCCDNTSLTQSAWALSQNALCLSRPRLTLFPTSVRSQTTFSPRTHELKKEGHGGWLRRLRPYMTSFPRYKPITFAPAPVRSPRWPHASTSRPCYGSLSLPHHSIRASQRFLMPMAAESHLNCKKSKDKPARTGFRPLVESPSTLQCLEVAAVSRSR